MSSWLTIALGRSWVSAKGFTGGCWESVPFDEARICQLRSLSHSHSLSSPPWASKALAQNFFRWKEY